MTISALIADPIDDYLKQDNRLRWGLEIVIYPLTRTADGLLGVGAGFVTIATLGFIPFTSEVAEHNLCRFGWVATRIYGFVLGKMNGLVVICTEGQFNKLPGSDQKLKAGYWVDNLKASWTSRSIRTPLNDTAAGLGYSDGFVKVHLLARGSYCVCLVADLVTEIFDGVVGLTSATLSLICLGRSSTLNQIAYSHLKSFWILHDCLHNVEKILRPWKPA